MLCICFFLGLARTRQGPKSPSCDTVSCAPQCGRPTSSSSCTVSIWEGRRGRKVKYALSWGQEGSWAKAASHGGSGPHGRMCDLYACNCVASALQWPCRNGQVVFSACAGGHVLFLLLLLPFLNVHMPDLLVHGTAGPGKKQKKKSLFFSDDMMRATK